VTVVVEIKTGVRTAHLPRSRILPASDASVFSLLNMMGNHDQQVRRNTKAIERSEVQYGGI
jgi:hypothetical protein